MRRVLLYTLFVLVILSQLQGQPVRAQNSPAADPESDSGSVVCPPGVYSDAPDECLLAGPSEYLTRLAGEGVPYPSLPLPAYSPPTELNDLTYHYFKVIDKKVPLYSSLQDLVDNQAPSRTLKPGELFFSYVDGPLDQDAAYLLRSGEWIRGDGARVGAVPAFQGLLFKSPPRNAFGWVLEETESHSAPGLDSPGTGKIYPASDIMHARADIVQIYAIQASGGVNWLLVGPDEWVDGRYVARVDPSTTRPEGVTTDRWIEVNLGEQTLAVYQNDHLVFATLVSSGVMGWATRPGLFQIYKKKTSETMTISGTADSEHSDFYYLEDVPWTMYFDEDRALHGEYWHTKLGYTYSHGCVNLSVGDAHWLFNWANESDFVYVRGAP